MQHTTRGTHINDCTYIYKAPRMSSHCPLMLWNFSSYLSTKYFPLSHLQCQLCLLDCLLLQHTFFKMENCLFTLCLDELFNLWNNAVHWMNYWVCTAGRYRSTSILERVHKAFFNYYEFNAMTYMPDEIILARMMTTLDLEFKRTLHYHDEVYKSNNDYGLSPQITRPIHVYSVFTTETSFNPADFTTTQHPISPFTHRHPTSLPFREGVCQHLTSIKCPCQCQKQTLRMVKNPSQLQT